MLYTRVPGKIRLLVVLALTFPIMAAVQIALAQNLPYWKLEWSSFQTTVPFVGALTLFLIWFLIRGSRFTKSYYSLMASSWFILSLARALQGNNAIYGVSLLIVSIWLFGYGWMLFRAFESPYIDSGQRWFEGAPTTLPRIQAEVETSTGLKGPYSVARLGLEGAYLIGPSPGKPSTPLRLKLRFKDRLLDTDGVLVRARPMNKSSDSHGIGVQFKNPSLDLQKEIADFVELLRGEGYVS